MGVEIGRKFLVAGDGWRNAGPAVAMRQGCLVGGPEAIGGHRDANSSLARNPFGSW